MFEVKKKIGDVRGQIKLNSDDEAFFVCSQSDPSSSQGLTIAKSTKTFC